MTSVFMRSECPVEGTLPICSGRSVAKSLAAVAPVAAAAADNLPALKPKPAILVGGTNDQRVKYEWMRTTFDAVRKLNGCAEEGKPWGEHCTLFPSTNGTPVVEFIHPGGHVYP